MTLLSERLRSRLGTGTPEVDEVVLLEQKILQLQTLLDAETHLRQATEHAVGDTATERDTALEEVERLRADLAHYAEGDCSYGDNCPPFSGSRHYQCDSCRARVALAESRKRQGDVLPEQEVLEKAVELEQRLADVGRDAKTREWMSDPYWKRKAEACEKEMYNMAAREAALQPPPNFVITLDEAASVRMLGDELARVTEERDAALDQRDWAQKERNELKQRLKAKLNKGGQHSHSGVVCRDYHAQVVEKKDAEIAALKAECGRMEDRQCDLVSERDEALEDLTTALAVTERYRAVVQEIGGKGWSSVVERLMVDRDAALEDVANLEAGIKAQDEAFCLQYNQLVARMTEAEAILAALQGWTVIYGRTLCPPGPDTYGEGMRDAKAQVKEILHRSPAQQVSRPDAVCLAKENRARIEASLQSEVARDAAEHNDEGETS